MNPLLQVYPGGVRRLRILKVSNARFYRLAIEGHALSVIMEHEDIGVQVK